ncbi:hypothetical protein NB311A_05338 [Nitrobacter sp. Nb-311A]|nr:hypothetical protein NB311A_05338 [Nitrobacter sp. Nb-311A]
MGVTRFLRIAVDRQPLWAYQEARHRASLPRSLLTHRSLEHDPEKWKPVSEKIMLKQKDQR